MKEAGRGGRDILLLSNTLTRLGRPLWREALRREALWRKALWRKGAQQEQQEDRLAVWGETGGRHRSRQYRHGSTGTAVQDTTKEKGGEIQ